jgi:hypothetical protein
MLESRTVVGSVATGCALYMGFWKIGPAGYTVVVGCQHATVKKFVQIRGKEIFVLIALSFLCFLCIARLCVYHIITGRRWWRWW